MPSILRALLEAELAAGNQIFEVGHSFPAPPVGAYFLLTKPLLTRPQKSGDCIDYYDRNTSIYSGEITDARRHFFLLEPPHPPEPEPDMNAIRAAMATSCKPAAPQESKTARAASELSSSATKEISPSSVSQTLVQRFRSSMVMDFEKWHDGIGYDLEALREMSPAERKQIQALLIGRGLKDWRDVEALACFDTPEAHATLKTGLSSDDPEVRNAVTRYAPELVSADARTASLVKGLETAVFYGGLTQTLDQVADFYPPRIVDALLRGALNRSGDIAVHFAAMLFYIHGKAPEVFDWGQRPFFLRFNTSDRAERETVFRELCEKIGVDAALYLPTSQGK